MDECSVKEHGFEAAVTCILTYGGNRTDTAINYTILLINLAACYFIVAKERNHAQSICAIKSFALVVCFQILLCLLVGCSGISIIWCACAGWMIRRMKLHGQSNEYTALAAASDTVDATARTHRCDTQWLILASQRITLGIDALAVMYYFCTTELITTIAHVCAVILGMMLYSPNPQS
ncbi:hypothetical protein MPSEU_000392500 [Mayamaea pseudoterrestris]|nr:hypothetical protein MPSEU_000392500 [Mayamaea pseudoterrestris]